MSWLVGAGFGLTDWLALLGHYLVLSVLAIGGAISTASDMHRYVVRERGWLDDAQFTDSIALAQAAPGPNVLFVAVLGYNIAGLAGLAATMLGTLLPSTTLAVAVGRYGQRRQDSLRVRAFTAGMAPVTLGLMLASGWVLTEPTRANPAAWMLVAATALLIQATRLSPMWLIGLGALVGAMGWV